MPLQCKMIKMWLLLPLVLLATARSVVADDSFEKVLQPGFGAHCVTEMGI